MNISKIPYEMINKGLSDSNPAHNTSIFMGGTNKGEQNVIVNMRSQPHLIVNLYCMSTHPRQ